VLIQLEERANGVKHQLEATKRKKQSDQAYLEVLDTEIARQKQQLESEFQAQIAELDARVKESVALSGEKKALVEQQNDMIIRNVASPKLVRPTLAQQEAALHRADAARAKLQQKQVQLKGLQAGVFVGDDLMALGQLMQKRRDIDVDARRLEIEQSELEAVGTGLVRLGSVEEERIQKLSAAKVVSATGGNLLSVEAATGRLVKAGDTLASLVDCDRRFVVAIFSYRQGQNLAVGSRVRIDGAPFKSGMVRAVLPKNSDKSDERFAVPFPQTERRELYAIIAPDSNTADAQPPVDSAGKSDAGCGIGEWVTVTRETGIVPSASVTWRRIQRNIMTWWDGGPGKDQSAEARRESSVRRLAMAMRNVQPDPSDMEPPARWPGDRVASR
jgi:multidrug resistance efflux pump